jgi:hypothetical protein
MTLPEEEEWCLDTVTMIDDAHRIAQVARKGNTIAISDGS